MLLGASCPASPASPRKTPRPASAHPLAKLAGYLSYCPRNYYTNLAIWMSPGSGSTKLGVPSMRRTHETWISYETHNAICSGFSEQTPQQWQNSKTGIRSGPSTSTLALHFCLILRHTLVSIAKRNSSLSGLWSLPSELTTRKMEHCGRADFAVQQPAYGDAAEGRKTMVEALKLALTSHEWRSKPRLRLRWQALRHERNLWS